MRPAYPSRELLVPNVIEGLSPATLVLGRWAIAMRRKLKTFNWMQNIYWEQGLVCLSLKLMLTSPIITRNILSSGTPAQIYILPCAVIKFIDR